MITQVAWSQVEKVIPSPFSPPRLYNDFTPGGQFLTSAQASSIEKILTAIDETVQKIKLYRTDEGKVLCDDFIFRISNIENLLEKVIEIDPERIVLVKEKLRKAIADLEAKIDENRFEQELIYYIEKLDITEEKVRLKNHLEYFKKELSTNDSNGKKLAFITQEIGREINTIGSKSNFADMQKLVVQMKDELEKIKEQSLNIL